MMFCSACSPVCTKQWWYGGIPWNSAALSLQDTNRGATTKARPTLSRGDRVLVTSLDRQGVRQTETVNRSDRTIGFPVGTEVRCVEREPSSSEDSFGCFMMMAHNIMSRQILR